MDKLNELLKDINAENFETIMLASEKNNIILEPLDMIEENYKGLHINRRYYTLRRNNYCINCIVIQDVLFKGEEIVKIGNWKVVNKPSGNNDKLKDSLINESIELRDILNSHKDLEDQTLVNSLKQLNDDYPDVNYKGELRDIFMSICSEVYNYCCNKKAVIGVLYTI